MEQPARLVGSNQPDRHPTVLRELFDAQFVGQCPVLSGQLGDWGGARLSVFSAVAPRHSWHRTPRWHPGSPTAGRRPPSTTYDAFMVSGVRDAATTVLLRDAPGGLEAYLMVR